MGKAMSVRGREFFDEYVANTLNNPELAAFTPDGHAFETLEPSERSRHTSQGDHRGSWDDSRRPSGGDGRKRDSGVN